MLLLIVSETGLVYTFSTPKFEPIVTQQEGRNLIQACLNAPDEDEEEEEEGDEEEDVDDAGENNNRGGSVDNINIDPRNHDNMVNVQNNNNVNIDQSNLISQAYHPNQIQSQIQQLGLPNPVTDLFNLPTNDQSFQNQKVAYGKVEDVPNGKYAQYFEQQNQV